MLMDTMLQSLRTLILLVQSRFSLKSADPDQMLSVAATPRSPVVEPVLAAAGAVCKVEVVVRVAASPKMQVEATSNNAVERAAT